MKEKDKKEEVKAQTPKQLGKEKGENSGKVTLAAKIILNEFLNR